MKESLVMFRRVALTCNDLQDSDARLLVDKVTAQYDAAGSPAAATRGMPAAPRAFVPELHEISLYG